MRTFFFLNVVCLLASGELMAYEGSVMLARAKGNSVKLQLYRMALITTICHIWKERNQRRFQNCRLDAQSIVRRKKTNFLYTVDVLCVVKQMRQGDLK